MKAQLRNAHIYRRIISLVLTLVLLFLAIPQTIFAEIRDSLEEDAETVMLAEAATESDGGKSAYTYNVNGDVYELEDRREASVKHFRTEDGSIVAAQYPTDVHILDDNGKWQDIDNTLSDLGGEYGTGNTGIKFAKKVTGNESLFAIHDGNGKLTMSLDGAIKKTAGKIVTSTAEDGDGTKLGKLMNLENFSSRIVYENILNGVDLEYITEGRNVKENIIVKQQLDSYSFTFTLKLNNLEAELIPDGSVRVFDGDGETVFSIPAPITYDAAGNYAPTESTYFTLEVTKNGNYALTVTQDATWMNAEDRAYPVTIDPTLNSTASNMVDTYIKSNYAATSNSASSNLYVLCSPYTPWNTYLKITSLPNIPSSACVTEATISLYALKVSDTVDVGIYNVTSDWDSTLTWSAYSAGTAGAVATSMCDYVRISAGSDDKWYTWDITDIVEDWYSGTANYGICFKQATTEIGYVYFASSEHSTTAYRPQFTVTYRDIKGLESYYSYLSQDIGLAGTGYVNLATGKLTLTNGTLTTTDSLFAFTPTLVYNYDLTAKNYTYSNAEVPYTDITGKMPYGFKWNFQQSIIKREYTDSEGTTKDYYVWADSDGTEHAFYYSETVEDIPIYTDEDALQLNLFVIEQNGSTTLIIKGQDQLRYEFSSIASVPSGATFIAGWYLTSITDINGNKLSFDFKESTYMPTAVNVTPSGGTKIKMLDIEYSSAGVPCAVVDYTAKKAVILRYSSSATGVVSSSGYRYLRTLTWISIDAAVDSADIIAYQASASANTGITLLGAASYNYKTNSYLTNATDSLANYQISYVHRSTTKSIATIMEYADNKTGQSLNLSHYGDYARVQSPGADDVMGTADDIYSYYNFDKEGRVISSYSKNKSGNLCGASFGAYEEEENAKNNIKHAFSVGGSPVNLLLNGSFEKSSSSYPYWTVSGTANLNTTGPAFIPSTSDDVQKVTQTVTLPAGTYTLSVELSTYDAEGVDITLCAVGNDESHNFVKAIPVNEAYTVTGTHLYSMTFTTQASDTFDISLMVSGGTKPYMSVVVYEMALESGITSGDETLVQMGGFDNLTTGASVTDFWQNESNNFSVSSTSAPFGNVAAITSDITKEKYVKQTVAEFSYDAYSTNGYRYFVSGFGKAAEALVNDRAKFAIRVDVYYYVSASEVETEPETHRFEFNKNNTDWQFVSGTFETREYSSVYKIIVMCEYAYQPYGTAYFDNISVCGENKSYTEYEYYENGRVYYESNAFDRTYYEYDSNGFTTRVANDNGELTDYEYDGKGNLVREIDYTFVYTFENGLSVTSYPICPKDEEGNFVFEGFDADSKITKTPKYATDYEYDGTYGFNTSVTSYPAVYSDSNVVQKSGSKKITSAYEYNVTDNSRIFGALLSETDSAGREVRYYYDNTNGYLMASVNVEGNSGTAYTYDALGNLVTVMPATYTSDTVYATVTTEENIAYTYDEHNRLSKIATDSTEYNFAYDSFGKSTSISVGTNALASYEYNSNNGKLGKLNYANGVSTEYVYDDLDNIKEIWYTENEGTPTLAYSYTYTAKGQLFSIEDCINGRTTVYEYDRNGRVVASSEYDTESYTNIFGSSVYYDDDTGLVATAFYRLPYLAGTSVLDAAWNYSYRYNDDQTLSYVDVDNPVADGRITYTYDDYYRLSTKVYDFDLDSDSTKEFVNTTSYTYKNYNSNTGIELEGETIEINGSLFNSFEYTYDAKGYIVKKEDVYSYEYRYVYDDIGQLIREDNGWKSETYIYTYDNAGNITSKKIYSIAAEGTEPTTLKSEKVYAYENVSWGDQLTAYNGTSITYDSIGNPLTYHNGMSYNFTWVQGRRLEAATKSGRTYTYTYNSDGIRTSKTVNGITKNYVLNGTRILGELWSDGTTIVYIYDAEASPIGMLYRESTYAENSFDAFFYERNLQGDIIAVYSADGTKLVNYFYDAWGNVTTTYSNGGASTGAQYNPFTYRGYYRDSETGFYYLNSRYYDPVIGRFINTDSFVSTGQGLTGYNMFAYCGNNPVMFVDAEGELFGFCKWIKNVCKEIKAAVVKTVTKALTVTYDVPVYSQGSLPLCWAYSQVMVESYHNGTVLTQEEADKRAEELSRSIYGDNWKQGGWPTNTNIKNRVNVVNTFSLYILLKQYGPLYAYYNDGKGSAHLVVITGVDVVNNIVYTNNPWGIKGTQSFSEFKNGFVGNGGDEFDFQFILIPKK